ncbi:MAG: 50S ribosomal protein L11 [Patescibacteria group bacterium]
MAQAKGAKKVKSQIKLVIQAGKANPTPPVGSTLGPTGINLMQFCQEFNKLTGTMNGSIPCDVTVFEDRTYEFVLRTPAVSELVKQSIGITSGSSDQLKKKVGTITKPQITAIADKKMVDLNCYTVEQAEKMVIGTCRSMGVKVENE